MDIEKVNLDKEKTNVHREGKYGYRRGNGYREGKIWIYKRYINGYREGKIWIH
jgi:hypothetical protein